MLRVSNARFTPFAASVDHRVSCSRCAVVLFVAVRQMRSESRRARMRPHMHIDSDVRNARRADSRIERRQPTGMTLLRACAA